MQVYFENGLIGIYLHGSLAMGGFNEISSDIDILIVTKNKLSMKSRRGLSQIILKLSEKAPAKGFELSIVALENLKNFVYPTPYEFHFSMDRLQSFRQGKVDFADGKTDPDLAAHFVITKERGICLFGEPIAGVFPNVPRKYYLDSVIKDVEWSYEMIVKGKDNGTLDVPVYGVLNFCRVVALINEGTITSKLEGGKWGLSNLPEKYYSIIEQALKEKTQSGSAEKVDAKLLRNFAEYSIRIIREAR